ncbi:hypothetical protein FAM09_28030 [Niastella caeni]|uniref:SAM-dependent MTase RsmB/NOP-type domain-containing protein n=2 Tax=Niastella caeni TaxID=2569763 RepID=A0A4S8HBD4_9BACT|nr:hypothetical protein FAM09_28030 [Niastella caeni]
MEVIHTSTALSAQDPTPSTTLRVSETTDTPSTSASAKASADKSLRVSEATDTPPTSASAKVSADKSLRVSEATDTPSTSASAKASADKSLRVSEATDTPSTSASAKASADKPANKPLKLWDACAASGGKSILAYDIFKHIDLTVSDVRKSILSNLEKRFAAAGIKQYNSFIGDISTSTSEIQHATFDIIITDVPCTGSGTWSRTPEQLYYFDPHQIERYSALQKKIVSHAIPHLKPGGFLLYCTCSVFKKENEDVVQFISEQYPLQLLEKELMTGYDKKADTLFGAVFQKR